MGEMEESVGSAGAPAPFEGFDRTHFGPAASKPVATSRGYRCRDALLTGPQALFACGNAWMILPPVFNGQFYVSEAANGASGFRAPIARDLGFRLRGGRPPIERRLDVAHFACDRRQPGSSISSATRALPRTRCRG
jgi:hypothetical protein